MEQSNASIAGAEMNSAKQTSLGLAVTLSLAAFLFAFVQVWIDRLGLQTLPRIGFSVLNHPQATSELVATAIGGSLLFPLAHVAIASLFKSKRNPSSRRRIFIGWSVLTIMVGLLHLWSKSKGY